jgi:hypothetical protein
MWRIGRAPNSILIYLYIQQDATLHSLFISGNCSTCFGWYFHPSSGAHTTASTASGISHTVTAICRYRGRVGTGLSVSWLAYASCFNNRDLNFIFAVLERNSHPCKCFTVEFMYKKSRNPGQTLIILSTWLLFSLR